MLLPQVQLGVKLLRLPGCNSRSMAKAVASDSDSRTSSYLCFSFSFCVRKAAMIRCNLAQNRHGFKTALRVKRIFIYLELFQYSFIIFVLIFSTSWILLA